MSVEHRSPIVMENPEGAGPFVIVCDHASNRIPDEYRSFGYAEDALATHIAWDPGALAVSRRMSALLDASLLWPDVSRLIIDCNRPVDAASLIVTESEGRPVPANRNLNDAQRTKPIERVHSPYHQGDRRLPEAPPCGRRGAGADRHSLLHAGLSRQEPPLGDRHRVRRRSPPCRRPHPRIASGSALAVGINQPYAPADQVYYTVERHAGARGLPAVMIEIRNDEIGDAQGQRRWADRLADILMATKPRLARRHAVV